MVMLRIVHIADKKSKVKGQRQDDEEAKNDLFRIHGDTWLGTEGKHRPLSSWVNAACGDELSPQAMAGKEIVNAMIGEAHQPLPLANARHQPHRLFAHPEKP